MSPRLLLLVMIPFFTATPADAESFKSWAARGAREEREKDHKAAFSSYSNALSMWDEGDGNPSKAKVLCARANLREKQGDDAGALLDFSDCLALDKKNSKGFHRRGLLLLKANKTPEAIGDFYRAVALDISFAQAYADRARAYESQGEKDFAREDYKNACNLGVKPACAKSKALAPQPSTKAAGKPKAPVPAPTATPAKEEMPTQTEEAPADSSPPPAQKNDAAPSYYPKFKDCLTSLDSCVENGDSFGACVRAVVNCDKKSVKGCCPAACLKAYQKAINRDRSEAASYREHFSPDSSCGIPPKPEED